MRRNGIDVGGDDVGLDLVAFDVFGRAGMVDRVHEGKQLARLVARTQLRKRKDYTHGGVAILPAIFAQARRITPDIAGIVARPVERRREQQRQSDVAANQVTFQRLHCQGGARGIGGSGQHRPGLGNGVDPAFLAVFRTEPRSVIERRTAIPLAVPGLALERLFERGRMSAPASGTVSVAAFRQRREKLDGSQQQLAEPHTLALAAFAGAVHAVVPVAGADERQSVFAGEF